MGFGHFSFEACFVPSRAGLPPIAAQPADTGEWRPLEPTPGTLDLINFRLGFLTRMGPEGSRVLTLAALVPVFQSCPHLT